MPDSSNNFSECICYSLYLEKFEESTLDTQSILRGGEDRIDAETCLFSLSGETASMTEIFLSFFLINLRLDRTEVLGNLE